MLFICLGLLIFHLPAEKLTVFTDLVNPDSMVMDDSNIYIAQQAELSVYDAKTFKLKTTFGKKGQGPREIPPFPIPMGGVPLMKVTPQPDKLFIAAMGKILYFTKEGQFISETKFPAQRMQSFFNLFPLGSDIFCQQNVFENQEFFISAALVDQNFKTKKELKRRKVETHGGKIDMIGFALMLDVYRDEIFIGGDGLSIDVYDRTGKFLRQIKHPHEPVKFTDDMKKELDEAMKYMFKNMYEQIKNVIYYPDYLPVFFGNNFQFFGDYLYVFTQAHEGDNRELFIFKLDGTLVKKTSVPLKMVKFNLPYPYDFAGKALYQLIDNEDTEEWELHRTVLHRWD